MRFGSVCSGIEAASVAFEPLGWRAAWFSEIEPFPSAVLAHHYPHVPNLGDMTKIAKRILLGEVEAPDVFCGGTPCQAFSVAGLRQSLADERGNLSLKFCELADAIDHVRGLRGEQPAVVLWENVPGVLSTKDNAFGCFLAGLAGEDGELQPPGGKWANAGAVFGPSRAVAWRTLDAQYFGLAQRRRRVFVVASAREGFDPAQVLFEWDRVRRDTAPSRQAGEEAAATLDARAEGGGFPGTDGACGGHVVPTLDASFGRLQGCSGQDANHGHAHLIPLAAGAHAPAIAFHPTQDPISSAGLCHTIGAGSGHGCATAAVALQDVRVVNKAQNGRGWNDDGSAYTVDTHATQGVAIAMQVRRLTPRECERLQGFPDDYTAIPWRKKLASECPDGPRYKALGNSWAVPCVRWIGARISEALR